MSTFFEKLTGSAKPAVAMDPAPSRQEVERQIKKPVLPPEESRDTPVKIVAEENVLPEAKNEILEEEGELTVDIYDRGDSIIIQSTVAGVRPEDLDISITNDTVSLRGRRERLEDVEDKNYYYKELFWGTFARSVILPEEIEEDLAEATLRHGLLNIRLPKKRRGVVQKLKVRVT